MPKRNSKKRSEAQSDMEYEIEKTTQLLEAEPNTSNSREAIPEQEIAEDEIPGQELTTTSNNEFDVLNIDDEVETVCFSSDEMLESVQLEDSTVELIGFIEEIDGPKIVGKVQNYRLLKFILNNNSKHRVQVVAWNDEIEKVSHNMKPNYIIHIDGGKARKPKISDFNHGTLPYEIIIQSNTIINNIGTFDLKGKIENAKSRHKLVELENIPDYINKFICVCGFIKTNFNCAKNNQRTFAYGSITNGVHKLEVQVNDECEYNIFEKGQHIEIKGYVKTKNDIFYLNVDKMSDVTLVNNEKMSFLKRLSGTKPLLKRKSGDIDEVAQKKITK